MERHTSVPRYCEVHRIVLESLLHIGRCFVANSGSRVNNTAKKKLPVLRLMYVQIGFGKQPFGGQHLLDYFWVGGLVAGARPEVFF